jgi:hypothetical protein
MYVLQLCSIHVPSFSWRNSFHVLYLSYMAWTLKKSCSMPSPRVLCYVLIFFVKVSTVSKYNYQDGPMYLRS